MGLEESIKRHPAGNLKRQAEESPHSLGWALGMAKKLGAVEREKEIIDVVLRYEVQLNLGDATDRDKMAMAHAIWVFRHGLAKAIKGEGENE